MRRTACAVLGRFYADLQLEGEYRSALTRSSGRGLKASRRRLDSLGIARGPTAREIRRLRSREDRAGTVSMSVRRGTIGRSAQPRQKEKNVEPCRLSTRTCVRAQWPRLVCSAVSE